MRIGEQLYSAADKPDASGQSSAIATKSKCARFFRNDASAASSHVAAKLYVWRIIWRCVESDYGVLWT